MSRFSGKCDFFDEIEIFGLEHILNSEVYVGDSKEPLKLTCLATGSIISTSITDKYYGRK